MDAKTRKKIDAVLDEAVELADSGVNEFDAARQALTAQTTDVLRELAVAAIVDVVRRRQRSEALTVERSAERESQTLESSAWVRPRKGTKAFATWVETTDEGREWAEREEAYEMGLFKTMGNAIREIRATLRMEWTAELLASEFALPDGTRVTWGDATVEQHEERASLFAHNAAANAEGAARHLKAVEALSSSGRSTLNELVGVAA